jgi:SAM-dependent MidA family methyltransferase
VTPLSAQILRRIEREGPISFHDFMEAALYDPILGYYTNAPPIGAGGDFYTSANLSPFSFALAQSAEAVHRALGAPADFRIVDFGAGPGLLASDVRRELERRKRPWPVIAVDPYRNSTQTGNGPKIEHRPTLEELGSAPTFLYANEVLDALPVHKLRRRGVLLEESFVGAKNGTFFEEWRSPSVHPRLPAAPPEERDVVVEFEWRPGLRSLFGAVSRVLDPGVAVFVDYGTARDAPTRPGGTIVAYEGHRQGPVDFTRAGSQDITADVDFVQAEAEARSEGLEPLGVVPQADFLIANGIFEYAGAQGEDAVERELRMLRVKTLVVPNAMGARFHVLGLRRGQADVLPGFEKRVR